jgi:hypothetical protein
MEWVWKNFKRIIQPFVSNMIKRFQNKILNQTDYYI